MGARRWLKDGKNTRRSLLNCTQRQHLPACVRETVVYLGLQPFSRTTNPIRVTDCWNWILGTLVLETPGRTMDHPGHFLTVIRWAQFTLPNPPKQHASGLQQAKLLNMTIWKCPRFKFIIITIKVQLPWSTGGLGCARCLFICSVQFYFFSPHSDWLAMVGGVFKVSLKCKGAFSSQSVTLAVSSLCSGNLINRTPAEMTTHTTVRMRCDLNLLKLLDWSRFFFLFLANQINHDLSSFYFYHVSRIRSCFSHYEV